MIPTTLRTLSRRTISTSSIVRPFSTITSSTGSQYHQQQQRQQQQQQQQRTSWNGYAMAGAAGAAMVGAVLFNQEFVTTAETPISGLSDKDFTSFKLKQVIKYNHNSKIYIFALSNPSASLDLPVSSCILARIKGKDGKDIIRPYTPIDTHVKGELHLLIKSYPAGVLSKHFDGLKPGDNIDFKGPLTKLKYEPNMRSEIGMIAGGTGITPMLQVLEEIFRNPQDKTKVTLLFANQTPDDILLKERLDALVKTSGNRFNVHYLVDKSNGKPFNGSVGYVTEQLIKDKLPAPNKNSLIYVCGPPPMMAAVSGNKTPDFQQGEVEGLLKKLGYPKDKVFKF